MMPDTKQRSILIAVVPLLLIVLPLGFTIATHLFAQEPEIPEVFLEMPDPQHEECVRDAAWMRYHHWELLRKTREEVVRYGKRGEAGLLKCMECHTSRERFCNRCHDAVSMSPDCYGCHYYP
jgi:hypothetical protein